MYQGYRKEINLETYLEVDSQITKGTCVSDFTLSGTMSDGSDLLPFIRLESSKIVLMPHSEPEERSHEIKLRA